MSTTFTTHTDSPLEIFTAAHMNTAQGAISDLEAGWIDDVNTWVYASATSFTIASVDATGWLVKGTKLKLVNGGSTKYFYVVSSSFSTNTTVNVTGGSDYTIANSAITVPQYSYIAGPPGFPQWFTYAPTVTGYSAVPANALYRFCIQGTTVFLNFTENTPGTSNLTTKTHTLPVTAKTVTNISWGTGCCAGYNNSAVTNVIPTIASAGTVVTWYVNVRTAFTASGTACVGYGGWQGWYEMA